MNFMVSPRSPCFLLSIQEEEEDVHLAPVSADDAPRVTNISQVLVGDKNAMQTRPSGRVVGIIKRNWHSYCGSLHPMPMPAGDGGIAHALFVSKDRRIPKIHVQTRQLGNLLDKRIIIAVDSWDHLSRYPSGHYIRTVGEIGDRDIESEFLKKTRKGGWMSLGGILLNITGFVSR